MTSMDADEFPDGAKVPLTAQTPNPTPAWKFGADENGEFPEALTTIGTSRPRSK